MKQVNYNLSHRLLSFLLCLVMLLGVLPGTAVPAVAEEPVTAQVVPVELEPLSNQIAVTPGQLIGDTGEIVDNDIYGYVVGYELKKGHTLSISDTDYVFSVRKLVGGNYSTMLKQATAASFTATEDMTVGMLIRKPDKSALTAEELASIVIYDTQYGMTDVKGYAHRFTVEAETIDGGTHTTRAAIFLPSSYSESGDPTRLIVMTNGHSAYLTDSVWNGNTADNVGVIQNYLNAGYAIWVVDNTAARTTRTPDLGCPQLVDSYLKAYEYIQEHFNVEEKFSIHSRSFGTFAAMRIMREVPELVKCAVMTGARVSLKQEWPGLDKAFIANRFGFEDTTGATYEADKLVGYDPYTDVDGEEYALPPTYWVLCKGDATAKPLELVEKLTTHGNDVKSITWTGTDHTGVCTLNTEEMFIDALAFLNDHQEDLPAEPIWEQGTIASADGQNNASTTRLRTVDYLPLSNYSGVGINYGYTMTNFVYDENYTYLGTSSWLGEGMPFTTAELQGKYPTGVYFRVVFRTIDQRKLTEADVAASGVQFYLVGEAVPAPDLGFTVEDVGDIGSWQDGAIWDGKLFALGAAGTGAVFDVKTGARLGTLTLDKRDILKPHANSVCFGSTYYAAEDKYPLLYVNIYNNYAAASDRMEGTCCVYRVTEENDAFSTQLVQVIRIGFTEDLTLWKSKENNGDVRPYGNFVVDTDKDKLYAFVMRDANKTTRFFGFDIPGLEEGVYAESYGCNLVTLEPDDIGIQFDSEYYNYLQGCCYSSGMILYMGDFGGDAPLYLVDLESQKVRDIFYLGYAGLRAEPEVICADPDTGVLYYAAADGVLRVLSLPALDKEPLSGKTISILGASISTYAGTSNGAAADTTNSTIRNNVKYYPNTTIPDVTLSDTWWMQACNDLGLRLLVNNSWSGSSLLHERSGTVGAYVDRCVQLHDNTGDNAGETPDIIGIQMGTNDFQYYKETLGTADIDYAALIMENADGTYTYAEPVTSLEAAAIVLHKISVRYPDAEVYYLNISQRVDGTDELIRSFNAELKQVVEHFGAHIVDIYGSAITMADFNTYIGDGRVHPNKLGMDAYTEAFKRALLANTSFAVDTHTVTFDLGGVAANYGDNKIVVDGDSFSVNLTAGAGSTLSVTVTMGGEDITDTCYADGNVTIPAVIADVTITAESVHTPQNYRWEFDGTDLVSVSGGNALTKTAGTTTDGVFNKTRYALETSIVLLHDQSWSVEWKSEGTWKNSGSSSGGRMFSTTDVNADYNARYIFKSATNWIIAMGEKDTKGSHNYGVALADYGIDGSAPHIYRLENRISDDGSNMVWLYVDGEEIGPMTNYFVGTTRQNTTSEWLSGKDFVFPYMGTDTHGFTNCSIEYIAVWEAGHIHDYAVVVTAPTCTEQGYTTYTCSCGDSYVGDYVDATGHTYKNGSCTVCKYEPSTELVITEFVNGTYSNNSLTFYPNTRLRHDPVSVKAGDRCSFSLPDGWSGYICLAYRDQNWDYTPKAWVQEYSYTFQSDMDAFVVMRKDDNSVISSEEYAGEIIFTRKEADPDRDVQLQGYYQKEIDKTIESLKALIGDEPCLVFPMVSDIHYLESTEVPNSFDYCVANMKELAKEIDFDFIACLGDITEGDTTQEITSDRNAHIINGFTQLGIPYYQVIGNHDDNRYGDVTFTHEQLYENYLGTITDVVFDTSSMHKTNYYKDFDDLKIRCIFLNANTNGSYGYSDETCDWFEEAIKTENGLIVFTHIPPVPSQNYGAKYGTDRGSTRIREACENADNFLIMFSGHNHYDSVITEPFLSFTMNCQKFENENGDPDLWTEGAVKPQRVAGTESEDCFDIVVVRPESGRIDLVRFGAGEDRFFLIKSTHTHTYIPVTTAPTCTEQGYTTYTCSCGDNYVGDYTDFTGHSFGSWAAVDEDTRRKTCGVCGEEETIYRLSLPMSYGGFAYVEENPNGVYCGTHNVADVLGLKSGTYTNGEVTVTVEGTRISVSGTPTSTLYFDLQTGQFGTPDYKRDTGYSLPDGDYRFGLCGSGTQLPTICIRYPDGKGNLMSASQNSPVVSAFDVSGADFGVPYLYFPKNTTYEFDGQLVLTMGSATVYDSEVSSVEKITGTGEFIVDGFLWTANEKTAIFGYPQSAENKDCKLIYTSGSKEYIDIFLPQPEGYLQTRMNLANSTSTNAYGWRLEMMYACDDELNQLFPVTNSGEYEAAIKLTGRPDFMGMGAHGSEQMTDFTILVDGAEASLEQLKTLTEWMDITITRSSDFYDPADEATIVAEHTVEYRFDRAGLTVAQDVEWLLDETCAISYMMMFPVRREYKNLQITDTYFDDFNTSEYDVSQSGFSTYPARWTAGASKMTLYSEKSGVTATLESLVSSQLTGTGYKQCSPSANYNKLYFTICGGGSTQQEVKAGDVWHTEARYEVVIEKGTDVDDPCIFGHNYAAVTTPPTCTEQGYTTYTCICGDSYVGDYVDALGHDYSVGLCDICAHDAVSVTVENGILTITSDELEEGTLLYLAAYDEYGKFLFMEKIVWSGNEQSLSLPAGEKWQLMFVGDNWTPLRTHLEF